MTQDAHLMTEADEIISLIERTGLAYLHSSGCAVLNDGTWLQPEQWDVWVNHLMRDEHANT
jgi:endoglucanase Acf2